jgi:hypothetical protein
MSVDTFRALTHVRGVPNAHLAEPDGYDARPNFQLQRRTPLPLDAEVRGTFLTLQYCGHGPWAFLEEHGSLAAVEAIILSGSGVLSPLHEFLLAFVDGRPRRYEVRDESGRLLASDGMRRADWDDLREVDRTKCRVVWVGE